MIRPGRILLLALAVLHAGCAEPGTPVSPELPSDEAALATVAQGRPDLTQLATFHPPRPVTVAWARKWIGPAGGRLELHGFAIDVPAGAVSKATQFSIRLPVDPLGAAHVMAEFGPHSAEFNQGVGIELPYVGTSLEGSAGSVLWWNTASRSWVDMGSTLTPDGLRLRAVTDHFSLYGVGTITRGGGVTVSGG